MNPNSNQCDFGAQNSRICSSLSSDQNNRKELLLNQNVILIVIKFDRIKCSIFWAKKKFCSWIKNQKHFKRSSNQSKTSPGDRPLFDPPCALTPLVLPSPIRHIKVNLTCYLIWMALFFYEYHQLWQRYSTVPSTLVAPSVDAMNQLDGQPNDVNVCWWQFKWLFNHTFGFIFNESSH